MRRFPPEWAKHESVWVGFPSDPELWLDDLEPAREQVVDFARAVHAEGRGEIVRLVCGNGEAAALGRALLPFADVMAVPFFDIWLRDTAPLVVRDGNGALALDYPGNGWGGKYPAELDNAVAAQLARNCGIQCEARPMILEGGAIDADGAGLLVTTEQCVLNPNRNPAMTREEIEAELSGQLGIERVLWLGDGLVGDHTDGHVDNLARFVGPGKLALPEPDGANDPNADVYADAWARARSWGIEVVPLPSPGRIEDADGEVIAASYMNFYIGNATVVVPTYGRPNDRAAIRALAELFPDRLVRGLRADHILTGGGSFHCISQQIPVF